jgi:hypothetical protein
MMESHRWGLIMGRIAKLQPFQWAGNNTGTIDGQLGDELSVLGIVEALNHC